MRLIEDLGVFIKENTTVIKRYGLYECPICHCEFVASTYSVNSGNTTKCRLCKHKDMAKTAANEFINKAHVIHGDYDYSRVNYKNNKTKVEIVCKDHGSFFQSPASHLSGSGCPECANIARRLTTSEFVNKASEVHGKYDYSLVDYKNNHTKVIIICHIHGEFSQTPGGHLSGHGCPECSNTVQSSSAEEFILKSKEVHGDCVYDYSLVCYKNNYTKVKIICKDHGTFHQTPTHHLSGRGCPACSHYSYWYAKPAILYYLKVTCGNTTAYKIGITSKTIDKRFTIDDLAKITVIATWGFASGKDAYTKEQEILSRYKEFKYTGAPLLSSGNTELFTIDVLDLAQAGSNKEFYIMLKDVADAS